MANFFYLTLDTTAPANPSISIEGGATYSTQALVDCLINTSDSDTTGYQMKIWGDVDTSYDSDVQDSESNSSWITFQELKQVRLDDTEDGSKTLYVRIRDDVHNVSGQASDSIILDKTKPEVTISGPDVDKISKVNGKNESNFSFSVDQEFSEYKVKVVSSTGAAHDTGTTIGTSNGSSNMSNTGEFEKDSPINCTINGTDLENASAGDGEKIIKVFAKDLAGNWSA
ncbi:hypothetical protein [Desertibacillus haloalkaliphilus]|uniref:hypothetical protein n=1 Tax=Desertibacillus haloalkaliphilus TaxID=1328930 RepID=UPI001C275934|nr:hypothetical protein [Desertibacillus haloalkaliphilus]MBU8908492.1 hypothetical protein [Desertibacillus haloalkaliphilus]